MDVKLCTHLIPEKDAVVALYDSVGWKAYTRDAEQLVRALNNSLHVVCALSGGQLVGLARIVGDGETIAYLQDVLVHPDFQRAGVGRALMDAAFAPFAHCRQHVLLTDDQPYQRAFYEALGFTESRDFHGFELRAFIRFTG